MNYTLAKHIQVSIKYVYIRGNTAYWQRQIPKGLRHRYPSSGPLKINLNTLDPVVIASKVATLNRQHEAIWRAMTKDASLSPVSAREAAKKLLQSFGIEDSGRDTDEGTLDAFYSSLENKRIGHADRQEDPEVAYHVAPYEDFLSKPEIEALKMLQEAPKFLLTDALELYLEEHPKRGKLGFSKIEADARRVWSRLVSFLGDKPFNDVSRGDAKGFRDTLIGTMATGSVRRNLNAVSAVFGLAIKEKDLRTLRNVFEGLPIIGEGEDTKRRESLTDAQMATLRAKCKEVDDAPRWALAIQMDAGSRIAEVIGMALEDIHVDGEEVPYLDFRPHPWRTLKTDGSIRKVPLVGHALWAARRVLKTAQKGQKYAFPQYIKDGTCNADSASATLNKWMRAQGIDRTTHCFRHTMRDRLRNTGATEAIQDAVGGWGTSSIGATYGEGYGLKIIRDALRKTTPK